MKKIGMIGIGMMGHGIATNLLKHGHALTVLEHPGNQPLEGLIANGATVAKTASELASQSDVVILCVTGTPQVEEVLLGEHGVLKGLTAGSIVIDCSTAVPTSTERVSKLVIEQGCYFMDAPMTRTPKEAAEGRLNLLVGADTDLFEQCKPILACFAENIVHAGPIGAGHRMKLLHNYVSLGSVALMAEAAACAQSSGIAAQTFIDILAMGGGWGAPLERLKPYLTAGDTSGLRFSLSNSLKDLTYYNQMAHDMHADRTVAEAVRSSLELACKESDPQALLPELVSIIAKRRSY
jgi:3-hydroxyisobutyrate dehydrogenase-like beta-hydroxyacid dehydrogenase